MSWISDAATCVPRHFMRGHVIAPILNNKGAPQIVRIASAIGERDVAVAVRLP
jgi:hypothetical protein